MKKEYKTPSIEKLEFNYTDVVAESGAVSVTLTQNSGCEGSPIENPSGWTLHGNTAGCEKLKPANKQNWNKCST